METVEIESVKGKKIHVRECVAQPGFGTIRKAEYDGGECLVKCFSKEDLEKIGCGDQLYQNLLEHLEQEAPSRILMWPIDVSKQGQEGFCYVINNDLSSYLSLADFMEEKGYYDGWTSIVNAALCLISAFDQMKIKKYHYLHMTEDDIFIHPKTGRVLIANAEFIRRGLGTAENPGGKGIKADKGWRPAGCGRMLAPNYLTSSKVPDDKSDDYMLAVLLFEILYLHHPLEGYRAAAYPVITEKIEKFIYGLRPCFIYDEMDESNRPVRGIHINVLRRWGLYPDFVKKYFIKAFQKDVLSGKALFVSAREWHQVFMKLKSYIIPCTCGMENIWQPGEQKCRKCKTPLIQPSLYYRIKKDCYPVLPGTRIYKCQLDSSMDYTAVAGEFIRTKSNSSTFLLQNTDDSEWKVTDQNGQERLIGPKETVMVADKMRIVAKGKIITVGSEYI